MKSARIAALGGTFEGSRRAPKKLAARGQGPDHRWTVANPKPAAKSKRNLLWVSTSYFGEGLPWSFLHQMATEFLTAIRASNTMVGSTSLLHLSVTLKLLWSPIVDLFGRKRTWMWMMQVILGLGMFVVAAVAPTGNLTAFWTVIVVLSVLHATHDIACDGFYMQALDRKDQARFSGVRMAAFHVARLVGSSLLVFLAGRTNWMLGFGAAGVLMILTGLTNRAVAPHPPEHHPQDDIPGVAADEGKAKRRAFWAAYKTFFTQESAVLVIGFLFLYRLGDIMMFAMSKPLLRDLGVSTAQRGIVNGFSMSANIAGSLVGAAIVARRGLERWLIPMTYIQNLAIPFISAGGVQAVAVRNHPRGVGRAVRGRRRRGRNGGVSDAALPARVLSVAFRVRDRRGVAREHGVGLRLRAAQRAVRPPDLLHHRLSRQRARA